MKYDVFISYRRQDSEDFSRNLKNTLDEEFSAFIDKEEINPSTQWQEEIKQAIIESEIFLLIIGNNWIRANSNKIDWVLEEYRLARLHEKKIIPIYLGDVQKKAEIPAEIRSIQGIKTAKESASIGTLAELVWHEMLVHSHGKDFADFYKKNKGRYSLTKVIKTKGDLVISLAKDLLLDRDVVVRTYNCKSVDDRKDLKQKILSAIRYSNKVPHSVQIFDADYRKYTFIIMDFIEGGTLRSAGRFTHRRALDKVIQIGRAILDSNEDHCNLKPSNIYLSENAETIYLNPLNTKNSDQKSEEIHKELETDDLSTQNLQEELAYIAPENIIESLKDIQCENRNEQVDQYQLGLIGIELLMNTTPTTFLNKDELITPPSPVEIRNRTANPIKAAKDLSVRESKRYEILLRMTEPAVQDRYPTLKAAIDELSETLLQTSDIKSVRSSFSRCLNNQSRGHGFIEAFYISFMKEKTIKQIFDRFGVSDKKLESQHNHLQGAIFGLIEFAAQVEENQAANGIRILEQVAKKHGSGTVEGDENHFIEISPMQLSWFREVLIQTVIGDSAGKNAYDVESASSPERRNQIKEAWEKVLEPGIAYFSSII